MFFVTPIPITIVTTAIAIAFILYKYSTRNFDYWKHRNVPYKKPLPFIGNFLQVFALRIALGQFLVKRYNEFATPYFGLFVLNTPYLVLRSPDLIKSILSKDFSYFPNRAVFRDENLDSVSSKLLFLSTNPEWRCMRAKIAPAFSLGKVKHMVGLMNQNGLDFKVYLRKNLKRGSIEVKEACAKYATELVANCAFGIKANCFDGDEDGRFRVVGRRMFGFDWKTTTRFLCYFLAPNLAKIFKMPFVDPSVTDFIREFVWRSIEDREKTKIVRNDVIDEIIKIRSENSAADEFKFEGDRVVAQAGQYYTAGFETISSAMSFTLYELALQPKIQNKLRMEIKAALAQYGSTYKALNEMKYLNMVIHETLRKYPLLSFLGRICDRDYKIPTGDLIIEKGTPVYIPMMGLHYDPEYFTDPQRFDPERFSEQNKEKFPNFAYMPFGGGPRSCIGQQFGLVGSKLGLAHILSEFEVSRSANTPVPIQFVTSGILVASKVGLPLKFRKAKISS